MQNTTIDFEIIQKRKTKTRKVKAWTEHEDKLLKRLCQQYPRQWSIISSLIPDRNQNQCLHRYRRICQRGMDHTKNWTEDQDEMVQKLIKRVGKNWKLISEMLGSKTGKQIRQRYINKLDPGIKKNAWSKEEDIMLIKCIKEHGSKWSEISKCLPGRPENMIKNRFYSYIKKNYEIRDKVSEKVVQMELPVNLQAELPDEIVFENEYNSEHLEPYMFEIEGVLKESKENTNVKDKENLKEKEKMREKEKEKILEIPHMPSIMELENHTPHTPMLKEMQNIEMIDVRTFNHFSEHDLFYFLNGR